MFKILIRKFFTFNKLYTIPFIFSFMPIKKNRIFLSSFCGKHINCNPFYIYLKLKETDQSLKYIWVSDKQHEKQENIKYVKYNTLKCLYYLMTSKIIISNHRFGYNIHKRKKQYYIQTWHSSLGLKKIEKDIAESLGEIYCKQAIKDSKYIDLLISGSEFRTKSFEKNFWYNGKILKKGIPRNDILFSENKNEIIENVKTELDIKKDVKILLYAPTFRKNDNTDYVNSLNFNDLRKVLNKAFEGEWIIIIKLHPNVPILTDINTDNNIINLSSYDNLQGLLIVSDVLLTDYSSLMFDYALLKKPCFLYCKDFVEYTKNDRGLHFEIKNLPFVLTTNENDLFDKIINFNYLNYSDNIENFLKEIGSYENGNASEEVVNIIMDMLKDKYER